jgi:2-phosphosulfolactate phosphatase
VEIRFATLETCAAAEDAVVVIDVCRAFTTAAYALGAGAERILLAGTVEQALALREQNAGSLVMGEAGGLPAPGFDLWNSPVEVSQCDLRGRTVIQRTSAGTQGVVRSVRAAHLLAASFAVAGATARALQTLNPPRVTFVVTGAHADDPRYGQEDRACGEYIAGLLRGKHPDPARYLTWLDDFNAVHEMDRLDADFRSRFDADLKLCRMLDAFDWALPVRREDGQLVMRRSTSTSLEPSP